MYGNYTVIIQTLGAHVKTPEVICLTHVTLFATSGLCSNWQDNSAMYRHHDAIIERVRIRYRKEPSDHD